MGPIPAVGEHTDAILKEFGYDAATIETSRNERESYQRQRRAGPESWALGVGRWEFRYVADQPPSIGSTAPVMSAASGPHRNTINAAT